MGSFSWAKLRYQQSEQHTYIFESLGTSWFTWPFIRYLLKPLQECIFFIVGKTNEKVTKGPY